MQKRMVLVIIAVLMCALLTGCGKAEFNIRMSDDNGELDFNGGYQVNDELYFSGYNCTLIFKDTLYRYGIAFPNTHDEWLWPGQSNIFYRLMHVKIFGEEINIGEWTARFNQREVTSEPEKHDGVYDVVMDMTVNPGLTVQDIWNNNIGNVQSSYLLRQAYEQYMNGDLSVIDQWAFDYVVNITFSAPVYVLEGTEWAKASGNTVTLDIGKMMQDGGAAIQLLSSKKNTSLDGFMKTDVMTALKEEEQKKAEQPLFTDVPNDMWCRDAVEYMTKKGYLSGYQDGSFKPNGNITFAQLSKILYAAGMEDEDLYQILNLDHYAEVFMGWCLYRNLFLDSDLKTNGKVTIKQMDTAMTREQVIYTLVQFAKYRGSTMTKPEVNIPDITSVSTKYRDAVKEAYRYGITNGTDANHTFGPKSPVTRGQVCQMISNMGW